VTNVCRSCANFRKRDESIPFCEKLITLCTTTLADPELSANASSAFSKLKDQLEEQLKTTRHSNVRRRLGIGKKSYAKSLALLALDYVGIALPEFTARVSSHSHHLLEKLEKLHADVKLIASSANAGPPTQTFNRGDLEDIVLHTVHSEIVRLLQTQTSIDRGHITPDYGTMKSRGLNSTIPPLFCLPRSIAID